MKIASLMTIYRDANGLYQHMHALALRHVAGITNPSIAWHPDRFMHVT